MEKLEHGLQIIERGKETRLEESERKVRKTVRS
jgi:hypothetical protein